MSDVVTLNNDFNKKDLVWNYLCKKHFSMEREWLLNSGGGYCNAEPSVGDTCDWVDCKNKPFKEAYYFEVKND